MIHAINSKDLPDWTPAVQSTAGQRAFGPAYKDKTFADLLPQERDDVLRIMAEKFGLVKPVG
jgi:hypothetical protein